jgi:hypothetical protein
MSPNPGYRIVPASRVAPRLLGFVGLAWVLSGCGGANGEKPDNNNVSLVQACIRSTACGVKPYPRVSACIENYHNRIVPYGLAPVSDPIYRCVNGAESCPAIRDCFGAASSCDSGFTARCDDGKAVYCDLIDRMAYTYDCAAASMKCEADPVNRWSATCTGSGTGGGTISTAVCVDDGVCRATGETCTTGAMNRCQGERLEACLEGGWFTFDCAGLGLGPCRSEGSGAIAWARCTDPGVGK